MSRALVRKPAPRLAREERVDRILDAAHNVFRKKGYGNTAVSEIAARMGLVEANVYKYFGTKRELLLKVLDRWYDEMFSEYARALADVSGTRARVRLLVAQHLTSVKKHPLLCRLMFREVRSEEDYPGSSLHTQNRRYTQLLVDVLRQGVVAGELRDDLPPALLRDMIYGGIEHHAWNYLCGRGGLEIEAVAERITELVWNGASTRRRTSPLRKRKA